jgi:hypothetical protein
LEYLKKILKDEKLVFGSKIIIFIAKTNYCRVISALYGENNPEIAILGTY